MAWGFWRKLKDGFKKATQWVNNKVIKPIVTTAKKVFTPENVKKVLDTGIKLAPAITTAVATSQGAPPASGLAIGNSIQSIGHSLGLG